MEPIGYYFKDYLLSLFIIDLFLTIKEITMFNKHQVIL